MIGNVDRHTESDQQFNFAEGEWNMLQVVEHILTAETGILAFFKKYDPATTTRKPGFTSWMKSKVLNIWMKSPIKAKIPDQRLSPKGDKPLEDMIVQWETVRDGLSVILDNFPDEKMNYSVFKHPIAGPLTMPQTLKFMILHIERHTNQIKGIADKIKAA